MWKTRATRLEPTRWRLCHGTEVVQQSHQEEGKLLLFYAEYEMFYSQVVLYIYKCIMVLSNFFIRLIVEVCKHWQNVNLYASLNTNCTERFSCYAFHCRVIEPWKPASRLSGCINLKIWMRRKLISYSVTSGGSRIFPRGREPSRGGVNTPNFPENCMKSKEFGRPGGGVRPSRPP